ncbi:SigE family RNA polymerase sigma factor [Streptomycetaceae bacterium NBC_01309]
MSTERGGGRVGERWQAVDALVAARGSALKRYAYLLCGDAHTADDLVQEALIRTFARKRRLPDDPSELEHYVRRVLVNLVIDQGRRLTLWRGLVPRIAERADVADVAEDICERAALGDVLAQLPTRQRVCVVLHYYEDLPLAEIADAMGCSLGTVKSQLHEARKGLALRWDGAASEAVDTRGELP